MFHNYMTLVFLLIACITLVLPRKHHTVLLLSPLILLYAMCIMLIQYVYSLQLNDAELPTKTKTGYQLDELGLKKSDYPVKTLAIQVWVCAHLEI